MSKFQKMPNGRFLLTMVFMITMSLLIASCGNKNMEKAEEFMEAGMFVQASALLEKEIMDSPANAKAHLLFGMCKLSLGNLRKAESSFKSAIQLKPELGSKIGQDILKLARDIPAQDKSQIFKMLSLSISYDPALKNESAQYYADLAIRAQSITETIELLHTAMSFDSAIRSSASSILMEKADNSAKNGKLEDSYTAISAATSIDPNNRRTGLQILIDAFREMGRDMPIGTSKKVVHSILSLDRSAEHSVGVILQEFAKNDLTSGNVNKSVQWIKYILKEGITLSSDKNQIRSLLIDASNKTVANKEEFIDAMKTLISYFPDISQSASSKEKYLCGAYLWKLGNKDRSLEFLRQVPDKKGQLGLEFVNTHIPPGQYPVELNKQGDFGWGTFTFTVEAIEIKPDYSMTIQIRVRNHTNKKQHFIFARTNKERFYIVDDFGNKSYANPPHCVNTPNRKRFNSSNDAVVMEPKQEIIERLNFPPTPKGNTGISFISPKHNGHQWEIKFANINLRHVKFHTWSSN